MSVVLSSKENVKARRDYHCDLCGERIKKGDKYSRRTGACDDGMWTMHMHPECELYEQHPGTVDWDWYEDISDPVFNRKEAIEFAAKKQDQP
jgi:hypothetical protein